MYGQLGTGDTSKMMFEDDTHTTPEQLGFFNDKNVRKIKQSILKIIQLFCCFLPTFLQCKIDT